MLFRYMTKCLSTPEVKILSTSSNLKIIVCKIYSATKILKSSVCASVFKITLGRKFKNMLVKLGVLFIVSAYVHTRMESVKYISKILYDNNNAFIPQKSRMKLNFVLFCFFY